MKKKHSYTADSSGKRYEHVDGKWYECDIWYWQEWLVAIILFIVILILI